MDAAEIRKIRIGRATNLHSKEDGGISLAEWQGIIAADPELLPVDHVMGRNPQTGNAVRVPLTRGARWEAERSDAAMPFWWDKGAVVCHSAGPRTVEKAQALAASLGAVCILSVD